MNIDKLTVPLFKGGLLMLALHSLPSYAEQVQLFDKPPSAEEMGKMLFGKSQDAPAAFGGIKTRSIAFKKVAPEVSNPEAIAESAKAEVTESADKGIASIGLPIKFTYNSDEILPESLAFLDEIGKMLAMEDFSDKRLVIEGHTDAAGSATYNKQLSQRRANAVSRYLSQNFNIPASRLKALGLGESKPLPGYDPDDEANRRVQFYSAN